MALDKTSIKDMILASVALGFMTTIILMSVTFNSTYINNPGGIAEANTTSYIENVYVAELEANMQSWKPDNITCPPNEPNCNSGLQARSVIENTGFDPIQAGINIGRLLKSIFFLTALTTLFPIYLTWAFQAFDPHPIITILVGIFTLLWQITNVWLIIRVFKND